MRLPAFKNKAEVYIGVIIAIGIFLILSQAIVSLIFSAYDLIVFTRARTTARFLAEEQMETLKVLSFSNLGTVGGIPAGIIAPSEIVNVNGLNYTVNTTVLNVDDPFDGQGAGDENPIDYKKATIVVSWGTLGSGAVNTISLSADISPQFAIDSAGGTLEITVTDASGDPVPQASVTIVASAVSPPVNTTLTTDSEGKLVVPGASPCTSCYEITVTKTGMSTDRTYSTSEVTNPTQPHVTVLENLVSEADFSIDALGTLTINSTNDRASGFSTLPGQQFILRGEKIIGTDSAGTLIYKYANVVTTDGSGTLVLNNLEWDAYRIIIPTGVGWDVTGTNPLAPIILNPGQSQSATFSSTTGSDHRLYLSFTDGSANPIASVAATLKDNAGTFEASASSGLTGDPDFGQAFFGSLAETTYTLYATVSGYLTNETNNIIVTDYTTQKIILTPQ